MKKYTKPILITLASLFFITALATVYIPHFSRSIKMPDDEQFLSKIHCDGGNAEEGTGHSDYQAMKLFEQEMEK